MYKIVCIEWIDAEGESGWSEYDPKYKAKPLKTYGILVDKTKDWYVTASTYNPEAKEWADLGRIPKGMVQSIRVIEKVDLDEKK